MNRKSRKKLQAFHWVGMDVSKLYVDAAVLSRVFQVQAMNCQNSSINGEHQISLREIGMVFRIGGLHPGWSATSGMWRAISLD